MSLLMKALEKAARERGESAAPKTSSSASSAAPGTPLALEPVTPSAGAARAPRTPAGTTSAPAGRTREQAQAATVSLSQRPPDDSMVQWLRNRPVVAFGALAGLFLMVYGAYVYVQVAHPGLLARKAPAPAPPAAVAKAPPRPTEPAPAPAADPAATTLIPSNAILGTVGDIPPAREGSASPPAIPAAAPAAPVAPAKPSPSIPAATAPGPRTTIVVSRGDANAPRVNPLAADAYAALEAGRLDDARRAYEQLSRAEPRNIDALLGLAAIAQRENRIDQASQLYLKVLELEPRHTLAQSALIAIVGRADPQAAETRLKQLAAREPSAFIYFTLGNLYADQSQWSQAQQAYFQAHHMEPSNPDYAYNLAVGLEHLAQHRLALGFYRRAIQLAAARNAANFDLAQARERINQLAARVE